MYIYIYIGIAYVRSHFSHHIWLHSDIDSSCSILLFQFQLFYDIFCTGTLRKYIMALGRDIFSIFCTCVSKLIVLLEDKCNKHQLMLLSTVLLLEIWIACTENVEQTVLQLCAMH